LTQLARALDILAQLVRFDTETSKSNLPLITYVEDYLRSLNVDFVTVPNAQGDKAALFATIGPKIDGGILLSGHTDVVPVKGQSWTSDPFILREAGGRVYGRGSCDMKGFAALALSLIPEMQRARLKRPVHILLSYDEETTCLGSMDVIARFGVRLPRPAAVIVGEPTSMDVADAQKSIATYHTRVTGFEAHSAKPDLGANAIPFACALVGELYTLQDELALIGDASGRFDPAQSTISVGIIKGGTARNILAKECAFQWEFRGLPDAPQRWAHERFMAKAEAMLPRLRKNAPLATIETEIEIEIPGLIPDQGSAAETLALKLARRNSTIAVAYATEAGRFQLAGVPTVVCGPGAIDQAHQPDEYIELSQLQAGLDFLNGLIVELTL
jgi:acetylornithine deacetylase